MSGKPEPFTPRTVASATTGITALQKHFRQMQKEKDDKKGGRKTRRGGRKSRRGGRKSRKGGRMRTRASLKRAQKSYRRRRKASQCRGKGPAVCRSKPGCKYASGKKRRFCRNKKSTRRARR